MTTAHDLENDNIPPGESANSVAANLPGEVAVDAALVAEAVQKVNQIYGDGARATAKAMGEYLLTTFFGGDLDGFRSKKTKHVSFKALADHKELKFAHSALWYSVELLEQMRTLPEEIGTALKMSHHRLLIPVKDAAIKAKLANEAVESRLSKRDFEKRIREVRLEENDGNHLGRPVLPGWAKGIGTIKAAIEAAGADEISGDSVFEHRREKAQSRLEEVEAATIMLSELKERLQRAIAEEAANTLAIAAQ